MGQKSRGQRLTLSLSEYLLRVRFVESGLLSANVGNTLRGGFGKALRDISCAYPGSSCLHCPLGLQCAYGFLFETPVPADAGVMRRYERAPHPFVLRLPVEHRASIEPDVVIELALVLIGRASLQLPFVLLGISHLGQLGLGPNRVRFVLEEVLSARGGALIYRRGHRAPVVPLPPVATSVSPGVPRYGRFRVRFLTPLRLRVEDRSVREPEFAALVSAALRRLTLLCKVHDTGDVSLDAQDLVRQAKAVRLVADHTYWHDLSRYSKRQGQRMPLGGLLGTATFEGDIGTFRELLELAGRVHVGKGTSFGHGYFCVEEDDCGDAY